MFHRVLIQGNGIAAWTAALSLSNQAEIVLLGTARELPFDRGLGLWPAAVKGLETLGVRLDDCPSIPPAAYRNISGKWLSQAPESDRMQHLVRTIRYHDLLERIKAQVPAGRVDYQHSTLQAINSDVKLCVDAAGKRSVDHDPTFATHHSLSGVVDFQLPCLSFETLHEGSRFAAVPLPGKQTLFFLTTPSLRPLPDLTAVVEHCQDWHDPIPDLLHSAQAQDVPVHYDTVEAAVRTSSELDLTQEPYRVAIGDAAHWLPHNLAQGAALAVEDAVLLGAFQMNGSNAALRRQLEAYAQHRAQRYAQCRFITKFTDWLASSSGTAAQFRSLMGLVPRSINGRVFETALDYSLAEPSSGEKAWIDIHEKHVNMPR
eukprot:TRINITY_DN9683_c0_g1_i1.p2 TRINITY_DN9683_c0_g1~~TRINITY_DN9683_c0_g1_i1.p2  ORF type:complete len:384 (+),score=45.70 TRINITY_DN9683_c0_g1_i1:34-1152(+)